MNSFRKYFILILLNFLAIEVYCQTNLSTSSPIIIESTTLDTIQVNKISTSFSILWLNDTIRVNISNNGVKTDTSSVENPKRKGYFNSRGFFLSNEGAIQNCYCYALEKYFENNETYAQNIFKQTTSIDRASIEKILTNSFKIITEFSTKPRKNLKKAIPNDVMLGFVNKNGWTIHAAYYRDGVFYTKNGMFKPDTFKSLNKFLKVSYWDTEKIVIYKLDEDKIKSIYSKPDGSAGEQFPSRS
ncbi:hypothetical protein [Marinifilum fragile]|uniref:hypothetical protein n=1 Tax=Marinifilum fragile TaxID=570161 RepID=UPI002AA66EB1|nr:hypothetical protein [Marinifilum fragile]